MYGLTEQQILAIKGVLASIPEVSSAVLYGSRARGDYKPYSDLDISVSGNKLTHSHLAQLETKLDDLLLPFFIDLNDISTISNPALLANIHRDGKRLI